VAVEVAATKITRAGIALTGVGGATIDAVDAAQALVGEPLTADRIEHAGELAAQAAQPRTDHRGSAAFKRHIVRTFVVRLLDRVVESTEMAA
jgi:carbon-monoxide dehydrogenase medium subunit